MREIAVVVVVVNCSNAFPPILTTDENKLLPLSSVRQAIDYYTRAQCNSLVLSCSLFASLTLM